MDVASKRGRRDENSGALRHSIIFSRKFPVLKILANQNRVIICLRHHVSA